MSSTVSESITFMVIRGLVALAVVGVAFYCIGQGIHFFELSVNGQAALHVRILGLDISAQGLGAVIFGTGLALCFVGQQTAPRRITDRTTQELAPVSAHHQGVDAPHPGQQLTHILKTQHEHVLAEVGEHKPKKNGPTF